MQKITSENIQIEDIKRFDIFVFGSNLIGVHGAGAASFAFKNGLIGWGQGCGLSIRQREKIGAYAIPTKGVTLDVLPLDWIKYFIDKFAEEVDEDETGLNFIVTKIGCGLAGFKIPEIAPLFQGLVGKDNVSLPQDFIDFYAGTYMEKIKISDKNGNIIGFQG